VYGQTERNYVALDYTAGFEEYLRRDDFDCLNHHVKFTGHLQLRQWTFNAAHRFDEMTGPNTQIGARVHSRDNITNLDAEYRFSQKTSIGIGYNQSFHDYFTAGYFNSAEYSPHITLFYHLTPKTDIFARFALGWVEVEQSESSTYEEFDFGIRGKITPKVTGTVRFGLQMRSFSGANANDLTSFVAAADLEAQLTKRTKLMLGISRNIEPSATVPGAEFEATRFEAKLSYSPARKKLTYWLAGVYEYDEYTYGNYKGVDRAANFFSASVGVSWDATKKIQLGIEYLFWYSTSQQQALDFERNLISIHGRAHF